MTDTDSTLTKHSVWRYTLPLGEGPLYRVLMPYPAAILAFQMQDDVPTIWVRVNPETTETRTRALRIVGTGHQEVSPFSRHLGTVQGRGLVWHLFEEYPDE